MTQRLPTVKVPSSHSLRKVGPMNKTNSKSVTTVALLATLLITGACSHKNDPANDLTQMQAITEERPPTAEERRKAEEAAAASQLTPIQKNEKQTDTPSTIAGVAEAIELGKYLGIKGAVFTRVARAVWKIVEGNQASANLSSQRLSILPVNRAERDQVAGFRRPITRGFTVTLRNKMGVEVVNYKYAVSFSYGGNVNGRGRYIENLNVIHSELNVVWGFNFDAEFVTGRIENHGTRTNPIAAIPGEVRWKVKNIMTNVRKSNAFWISGNGDFVRLNYSEKEDPNHPKN